MHAMNNDTSKRLIDEVAPVNYAVHPWLEAILVALAILVATTSTSYFIYLRALAAQEGEIRQGLLRTANVAATIIDPIAHQSYRSPEEELGETYKRTLQPLFKMQQSDPQIAYLYTAVQEVDGTVRFIYDVTPSPENPCALDAQEKPIIKDGCEEDTSVGLLEVYDASENEAMLKAFRERVPTTSDDAYTDAFGEFISGYVPLFDEAGKFYGILGMDIDIKDYKARLKPIKRATNRALVTGFFIAFITGSVVWFLRNFIAVLNRRRHVLFRMLQRAAMGDGGKDPEA
jgi:hypothetical protein